MSRGLEFIASLENARNTLYRHAAGVCRRSVRNWLAGLAALLLAGAGAQAQSVFAPEPVGTASAAQDVTVTATVAGTVSSVEVLTQGASGLDFAVGTGTSTCTSATLAQGGTCTESVMFTPSAPGTRIGAVVLVGTVASVQTVLGTAYIQGTGTGPLGVLIPGDTIPVAGQTDVYLGSVEDGKPATQAVLYLPASEALDGAGNMYIADSAHNRIRMVCASASSATISGTTCTGAGIISTIAGNGDPGYSGNGAASSSTLNDPSFVSVDGAGNVYIADTGNNVIREIVAATGQIVTVAGGGTGCAGQTDTVGDGCTALQATLNQPLGVTLDTSGNIYIADTSNERIRVVTLSTGMVGTVAGTGYTGSDGTGGYNGDNITAITAELNTPYAVAFDAAGNMYIPDSLNNRIRLVTAIGGAITAASKITTFAGDGTQGYSGDTHAATSAELWAPSGVAIDAAGNVYIADTQNQGIRKVNSTSGDITTLVKNGVGNVYVNNAFAKTAFYGPTGIYIDGTGGVYVADTLDMVVREIQSNFVALDYTTAVRQDSKSTPIPVTVENDGNADLDLTAITPSANAALDAPTTTCIAGPPDMASSTDCVVGAVFAPTVSGDPLDANIDVTSLTPNSPLNIELVGNAEAVNSTTTTITSTPNPSAFGQVVTFTVTVTTGTGTGALTGTVTIADTFNGVTTNLATGLSINSSGVATFPTATLAVGQHSIVASYSGDTAHFSSTSIDNGGSPLIQTVMESTKTTLTSSVNPSAPGQSVTFTATVAISGGGGVTPDGTVTFMDGATVLSTVPLASGTAAYATSTLTIGVHPITAVYSGDSSIEVVGSTSAVLNQDVQATSTVGLTSSLNPSNFGTSVTFTATITSGATTAPTGTVNFLDGATKIGSGTLAGNPAVATFATATLSVGTHSITAVYAGDANNSSGTSPVVSQVVNQTASTTTVASAPNPSNFGQGVTFTVTVTAPTGSGTLNGTVTIADTFNGVTTNLATGLSLNTSGVATFQTTTLAVGQHSIVATYNGDTNHATSSSAALIQSVIEATATTLVSSLNPSVFGQNVTFTATVTSSVTGGVTPDGTVTFMDGATALGTSTLTAGVATYATTTLAVGMHSITAVYSGDAANGINASTSAVLKQDVQAATTVTVTSSLNPSNFGLSVTFTATVASSATTAPTGTVIFLDNGKQIGTGTLAGNPAVATYATAALAVGTHPITATYAGDTNNGAGATASALSQVVSQTVTATTVTAVPNPGVANEAVALTATVKLTAGSATPTGTVTFTSGTTSLGSAPLTAGGTATINPVLAAGTYMIVATYSGDTDDGGSASAALSLTVGLATSTTTLTVSPNPAQVGATITFMSSVAGNGVAPTGTVSFFNGTTMLGTATLNAGTATFTISTLAVGNYSITASYSGDVNNSPSTSGAVSLTVGLIPTTTSLATSSTTGPNPQTILIAVVQGTTGPTPTGTVTFTSSGTTIGSATLDSSGVATLTPNLPTGNYSVVAAYGGDSVHSPSTSTAVSISGAPAGFSLTVTPATLSLKASENGSVTINLTSEGGFTDTIGFGCGSLPAGVTCTFSSNSVTLAANGTASAQLSIDTNTPVGGGATAMNHRGAGGASMAGLLLPLSALFGWLFWRLRKRSMGALTLVLAMALSAAALMATGCSGYSSSTAKTGSYVIQVIGTGTNSDVIHYQNVSLTITN
ncbi:MAG: Ig-like domain repeat protein [Terracidiphilus sp.]